MKNNKKLAIIKVELPPTSEDMEIYSKIFKNSSYRPVFTTSKIKVSNGNLIIG